MTLINSRNQHNEGVIITTNTINYGAITIDTSIFDKYALSLESGLFKTLYQFKDSPIHFILSEIVVKEVESHLLKKVNETKSIIEKSIRDGRKHLLLDDSDVLEARKILQTEVSDTDVVNNRLEKFKVNTGLNILTSNDYIKIESVVNRYFSNLPPFSESGKKKNEFPDAIALLTLEAWAIKNNTKIIAVSTDKDWKKYAENSKYIDTTVDLAKAISIFQPHNLPYIFCLDLADNILANKTTEIECEIDSYLDHKISMDQIDFTVHAESYLHIDYDDLEVTYESFEYSIDDDGKVLLQLIEINEENIIIELQILISVEASCTFQMSVHSSHEDSTYIGGTSETKSIQYETSILVTLSGDFGSTLDNISIDKVELTSYYEYLDFGYIIPNPEPDQA